MGAVEGTGTIRILVRRWYLVVVGIAVTIGLTFAARSVVPVTYQAEASVLLLPPQSSVGIGNNPYLALGGLTAAADVLSRAMSNDETVQSLHAAGTSGTYSVTRDLTTNGPVILVTADNSEATGASRTLKHVVDGLSPTLAKLQTAISVAARYRIVTQIITQDDTAHPVGKAQLRAMLVAIAAGLFGTLVACSLVDGLLLRRTARRSTEAGASNTEPELPAPTAVPAPLVVPAATPRPAPTPRPALTPPPAPTLAPLPMPASATAPTTAEARAYRAVRRRPNGINKGTSRSPGVPGQMHGPSRTVRGDDG
jgi:capsular polysaccharide biosynthesis protein